MDATSAYTTAAAPAPVSGGMFASMAPATPAAYTTQATTGYTMAAAPAAAYTMDATPAYTTAAAPAPVSGGMFASMAPATPAAYTVPATAGYTAAATTGYTTTAAP